MGFYADRGYSLDVAKQACLIEVETWYGGKVLDVFDSSATGVLRRYYCAEADQLRMVNGKISNTAVDLMCGVVPAEPDHDPIYAWTSHTSTEAGKVHTDYVQFAKGASEQRSAWITQINAATDVAQIDAIFTAMWG